MNKKYIGMLDGQNKINVYKFDKEWKGCWDRLFELEDGYRVEDDNLFCIGDDKEEIVKKLKELLVKEILNS